MWFVLNIHDCPYTPAIELFFICICIIIFLCDVTPAITSPYTLNFFALSNGFALDMMSYIIIFALLYSSVAVACNSFPNSNVSRL